MTQPDTSLPVTRDFTVAVFVVQRDRVLLHFHRKLNRWLPPGGHIEPNELPDAAAVREVLEETGINAVLHCQSLIPAGGTGEPMQLCRPIGIQLEDISPGHQHIDLIYFATAADEMEPANSGWYTASEWNTLGLGSEVSRWCSLAVEKLGNVRG